MNTKQMQEAVKKANVGKPVGATDFVLIPAQAYAALNEQQKEFLMTQDPYLREFVQGGNPVYLFWIEQNQLEIILSMK